MSFTYNLTVPAAANDPSVDQGPMLTNTNSIDSLIKIDHVTFSGNPAGTHKQVTYSTMNTPGAVSDPSSVSFTASGIASPSHPQEFYKNSQGTFPTSALRAFSNFNAVSNVDGAIVSNNSYNIASIVKAGSTITVTLNVGTTNGNTPVVFITAGGNLLGLSNPRSYTYIAPVLTFSLPNSSFPFSFVCNLIVIEV